jgi:outer membrane protein OmpA-like peptidoglycan-associated protein
LHGRGTPPGAARLHRENLPNRILHRELSAGQKRAKVEREARAAARARMIQRQRQMAAHEKSKAEVQKRLRIQKERLRAIASKRHKEVDSHGQTIIKEPGNRTIFKVGRRAFVQHDETANFHAYGGVPHTRRGSDGNSTSTIIKPNGVRIEVEVDRHGRPLRRVRHLPDGRRFVLFENRALAIGAGLALGALIVNLPPMEADIPPEQYIVDAGEASEDDIYGALQAGPLEPLDRAYSLEEVLASVSLRERMRSINVDSINFEFGSWEVAPDQAEMLESVAAVIHDMVSQNPGEVFLIEGHTDAVGSEDDNLSLSDRRAQSIAGVLSQQFDIPRENLVTQGYGEQFLLVPVKEPERRNRRVVIRRITPLLQSDGQYSSAEGPYSGSDGPEDGR